ncbi:MAG: hypothetical protein J6L88_03735 [Clostridia bacterium]|nr:hypothetical protein [Clostridia bacterium]
MNKEEYACTQQQKQCDRLQRDFPCLQLPWKKLAYTKHRKKQHAVYAILFQPHPNSIQTFSQNQ